jgi:hypothetical protein
MNTKIVAWLPDVVADEVVVAPADVCTEAQKNQWGFSVTSEEATALSTSDIETFISAVVRARCDALLQRDVPRGTMTFYCWFDEMAAQLRFSIVSAKRDALPFGCDLVDASLPSIASAFLSSRYRDGIPWSELRPVEAPTVDLRQTNLPIWSGSIP